MTLTSVEERSFSFLCVADTLLSVSIPERLIPAKENRQRGEQDRALKKIDLVIEATIEKLKTHGESGVNVKDIASETGVSYGAIYHHFKDRDGLIRAAQFERLRRQPGMDLAALGHALDNPGDLVDFVGHIQSIADAITDPERAKVRLVRSSVITSAVSHPELHEAFTALETAVVDELHGLVARAQELGIADPHMDPRAAAVYLEALSYGVVLMEFMENPPSREALAAMLFRGFAALLKPSAS
jgi:AcrR family transcriptional regulator